ncbi:hypothetical protein IFM89_023371 [Coptis chinensis]|uniref:Uncharacterized protein n=1 Tax=Coptis chinensis TaxID=261450 RepID=A0A835I5N1_9MAGN|nr:hypothetical protein IFM89_023371 [Coptis chinensis]
MEKKNSYETSWTEQWDYDPNTPARKDRQNKKQTGDASNKYGKMVAEGFDKTKAVASTELLQLGAAVISSDIPEPSMAADIVTVGNSWLSSIIKQGIIEPIRDVELQDWFKGLSEKWKALPQFGIYTSVRVCSDCFNDPKSGKYDPPLTSNGIDATIDALSRIDVTEDDTTAKAESSANQQHSVVNVTECKCGMPLCICVTSVPDSSLQIDPSQLQVVCHLGPCNYEVTNNRLVGHVES